LGRAKEKIRESVTRGRTVRSFVQRFFHEWKRLSTYKLDSLSRGRVKEKTGNIILV
jgi:hypothetical protein